MTIYTYIEFYVMQASFNLPVNNWESSNYIDNICPSCEYWYPTTKNVVTDNFWVQMCKQNFDIYNNSRDSITSGFDRKYPHPNYTGVESPEYPHE